MRMTITDHLLVERDLELGSRRGDTAPAAERTRSIGWVFAQERRAASRGQQVRRRSPTRRQSSGAIARYTTLASCMPKCDAQIVHGVMAVPAQIGHLFGPFFCAGTGGRTFRSKSPLMHPMARRLGVECYGPAPPSPRLRSSMH